MSAATVNISESNGVGETVTDAISNINFGSIDAPNLVAASHPIIQAEQSFNKYLRFHVASMGDSTTIKDLRIWKSAGAYVVGEGIFIKDFVFNGNSAVTYATPTETPNLAPYGTFYISDPGSAVIDIGGSLAGTIGSAPAYSGYFALILQTGASTPVGPVNTKTITAQYDET